MLMSLLLWLWKQSGEGSSEEENRGESVNLARWGKIPWVAREVAKTKSQKSKSAERFENHVHRIQNDKVIELGVSSLGKSVFEDTSGDQL